MTPLLTMKKMSHTSRDDQKMYPTGCIYNHYCWEKGNNCCYFNSDDRNKASVQRGQMCVAERDENGDDVKAHGDPHVQNLLGEKFDILALGEMNLLNVENKGTSFLKVNGTIARVGGQCEQTFISELKFSGSWVQKSVRVKAGLKGLEICESLTCIDASFYPGSEQIKVISGKLSMQVDEVPISVEQASHWGWNYLNMGIKNLHSLKARNFDILGLLGTDSHENASRPPLGCSNVDLMSSHSTPFVSTVTVV